ncbi:MAG: family 1 glycosylhydrolase [Janthinobacterium lividum]
MNPAAACPSAGSVPVGPLQLWGGIECSMVRVGDHWRDLVQETGHQDRGAADLAALASMGLRTLRYPVLWERNQDSLGRAWQDRQMAELQRAGIEVIGGLMHHGSGPAGTDLLDAGLAEKLAVHARDAAARYPGIGCWTPVNEPLTTARFSCLYGHWYPHRQDETAFFHAVVNQCRAALLAMRAIRAVQPDARFIHTEDIGRVFSTPPVAEQARYENARRWLSLDLLCGHVRAQHPFRRALEDRGVLPRHLDELQGGEAAPDLIGFNHYATSDRYLDHRLDLYPAGLRGGNGRQAYADTEAMRVDLGPGCTGIAPRLRETWRRYQRPIAITEAHLGCDDPWEQVRWLMEAWEAARQLRGEGADIRAVTAWALFGLVDWDTMLRERCGRYEPGAFDTSGTPPRPTVLAEAITALARRGRFEHTALDQPGWWRRDDRIHAALRRA